MIALHGIMIAQLGAMKQDRRGSRVDPPVWDHGSRPVVRKVDRWTH